MGSLSHLARLKVYSGFQLGAIQILRRGTIVSIRVNLSPGEFHEAVGELVEGQAPQPVAMLKLLHLIRVESHRT